MSIRISAVSGAIAAPYIPELARLRIEVFRKFPYLYDGDMNYEKEYLQTLLKAPGSVIVLAFDGDQVIGASTGLPMEHETDNIQRPWQEAGYETQRIFYFGESVLQENYRGRGIGVRFFEEREKWARQLARIEWLTFCGVVRPDDHPLRPKDYVPLDRFWKNRGFTPTEGLICRMEWKDLDQARETSKPLHFWVKALA